MSVSGAEGSISIRGSCVSNSALSGRSIHQLTSNCFHQGTRDSVEFNADIFLRVF